jgi:hypothetical protein
MKTKTQPRIARVRKSKSAWKVRDLRPKTDPKGGCQNNLKQLYLGSHS